MKLSKSTRERLTAWWEHRPTGRPCILATSPCGDPGPAPAPDDYWTKPELLANCVLARQRAVRFWGEAMPFLYMDYGAPAMALQMGAKASWTSIETLWADPCVETADEVAALRPGGYWKEIQDRAIREGISRCGGSAMLASYCLGASADTTAALMGSENLLCALIEDEEGVKRAFEAVKRIMIDAFSALAAQCEQGGTQLTGWHGIWSPGATTAIQEDFSGQNTDIQIVSVGGIESVLDAIRDGQNYLGTIYQSPAIECPGAMEIAHDIAINNVYPEESFICMDLPVVTAENVDEFEPAY